MDIKEKQRLRWVYGTEEEQVLKSASKVQKVVLVIPTYNEVDNLPTLFEKIFYYYTIALQEKKLIDLHILVVDDNSPDGTANYVSNYGKENTRVHLLLRYEKEGLGAAYKAGMKYALEKFNPDIIFEMDADHSHNPKDVFRMIEEIENGNDFVIGSRHVDGGGVVGDWGIHRRFISYCARVVTRVGLGLGDIKDSSGGFRAIRREVLETIDLDKLFGDGYGFQASILEAAVHNNFQVKEIPINFLDREKGDSKMRFSDMLEGWAIIYKIRKRRLLEKFGISK